MAQHFGIGMIAAIPSGTNPTPIQFGLLKDISIEQSANLITEAGQWQWPVAVGVGEQKLSGKIGTASIFAANLGRVLATTPVAGSTLGLPGEVATIPDTPGPYTITVANSAAFTEDCGVLDLTTGLWMTCGATATGTGVYAVSAGVYTFNVADKTHKVSIAYRYSAAASIGKTIAVTNTTMGLASSVRLVLATPVVSGKVLGMNVYAAYFPKFSIALKPDGFAATNLEWFAAEDGTSGKKVYDLFTAE